MRCGLQSSDVCRQVPENRQNVGFNGSGISDINLDVMNEGVNETIPNLGSLDSTDFQTISNKYVSKVEKPSLKGAVHLGHDSVVSEVDQTSVIQNRDVNEMMVSDEKVEVDQTSVIQNRDVNEMMVSGKKVEVDQTSVVQKVDADQVMVSGMRVEVDRTSVIQNRDVNEMMVSDEKVEVDQTSVIQNRDVNEMMVSGKKVEVDQTSVVQKVDADQVMVSGMRVEVDRTSVIQNRDVNKMMVSGKRVEFDQTPVIPLMSQAEYVSGVGHTLDSSMEGMEVRVDSNGSPSSSDEVDLLIEECGDGKGPSIRREIPKSDGLYVEGWINGEEVIITIDTGAESTLMRHDVYSRLKGSRRPDLVKAVPPVGPDGSPMKHYGQAIFSIEMGPLVLERKVTVVDMYDEILLGADILLKEPEGVVDILGSQNVMVLKNEVISLVTIGSSKTRKVRSADHYVIPAMSEVVVEALVDVGMESSGAHDLLIEPDHNWNSEQLAVVAPCLVDVTRRCAVNVRILNPTTNPISVKQDQVLGRAETISDELLTLFESEDPREETNLSHIRRIGQVSDLDRSPPGEPPDVGEIPSHLTETLNRAYSVCESNEHRDKVKHLLYRFSDAFSKDEYDLGLTHITEHVIETGNAAPIKQPPRRVPMAFAGEDEAAIVKLLQQGSIRPSTSPWASPIVLVRRKDGKVRTCVDYRRLNSVTTKDAFPIPRIHDCLDAVAGAVMFSTMDITAAYNQIPVRKKDVHKTAFCCRFGLMEFVTMPFGLATATATFQRAMEIALAGLQWTSCLIYLDDVIVFGKTFQEHLRRLELVLGRILSSGLKLKPSKCHLFQEEVAFLGHIVGADGVKPDPDNLVRVANWPRPMNVTEVRSFVGLATYYRRFVKSFADVAAPLTDLTKKGKKFVWSKECEVAFDDLKKVLGSPQVMAYPKPEGQFILDTDASQVAVGAVLSQAQDGDERVIAYGSKMLGKAERNIYIYIFIRTLTYTFEKQNTHYTNVHLLISKTGLRQFN